MSTSIELKMIDLPVGEVVPWDIFDFKNRLMLRKGMILHTARQVRKLIELGAYRHEVSEDDSGEQESQVMHDVLSPFDRITVVEAELEEVLIKITKLQKHQFHDCTERLNKLIEDIIDLADYDIDAVIGALHTDNIHSYPVTHALHTSVLCYIVGKRLSIPPERLRIIIGANLTSNVGMFQLQDALSKQDGPLTIDQRYEIEKHPLRSVRLLKRAGVKNKLWLEIVAQHHEQNNGHGYPRRLRNGQFMKEARLVSIADRYHALISARSYRKGMTPTQALKQLFQTRGRVIDEKIGMLFIKEMGVYPPGAYVRLKNGELAMVTRRTNSTTKPKVKTIINARGESIRKPVLRDCSESEFEVLGLCPPPQAYRTDLHLLWDYAV